MSRLAEFGDPFRASPCGADYRLDNDQLTGEKELSDAC